MKEYLKTTKQKVSNPEKTTKISIENELEESDVKKMEV